MVNKLGIYFNCIVLTTMYCAYDNIQDSLNAFVDVSLAVKLGSMMHKSLFQNPIARQNRKVDLGLKSFVEYVGFETVS